MSIILCLFRGTNTDVKSDGAFTRFELRYEHTPVKGVNFIISAKMTPLSRTLMKLNSTFKHQTVHSNMQNLHKSREIAIESKNTKMKPEQDESKRNKRVLDWKSQDKHYHGGVTWKREFLSRNRANEGGAFDPGAAGYNLPPARSV